MLRRTIECAPLSNSRYICLFCQSKRLLQHRKPSYLVSRCTTIRSSSISPTAFRNDNKSSSDDKTALSDKPSSENKSSSHILQSKEAKSKPSILASKGFKKQKSKSKSIQKDDSQTQADGEVGISLKEALTKHAQGVEAQKEKVTLEGKKHKGREGKKGLPGKKKIKEELLPSIAEEDGKDVIKSEDKSNGKKKGRVRGKPKSRADLPLENKIRKINAYFRPRPRYYLSERKEPRVKYTPPTPIGAASPLWPEELRSLDIQKVSADNLDFEAIPVEQPPVPKLSYGLDRVLFNPGVYNLRDARSRVYNFDPYLEDVMPVHEFNFSSLGLFMPPSKDPSLAQIARDKGKRYIGSTSSMSGVLMHFHFLLSQWRDLNFEMLSKAFGPVQSVQFTSTFKAPAAIILRWRNGTYAIDADKQFDSGNILSMLGKSLEKLLTLPKEDYERYRKSHSDQITQEERAKPESYHYSGMGGVLVRSQLDAYDPRLPGTGMFDLKTRAVVTIRMDSADYEKGLGYQIKGQRGLWESYEREYHDMIRTTMFKYSLQVRMGRMDGIFVAYHNVEQIFGFQYVGLEEMDLALHGQSNTTLGDGEFRLSLDLFNKILDKATKKFPEQSIRLHFETRTSKKVPFMYIFAEPVTEEEAESIQKTQKERVDAYERKILGLHEDGTPVTSSEKLKEEWRAIQAQVDTEMEEEEDQESLSKDQGSEEADPKLRDHDEERAMTEEDGEEDEEEDENEDDESQRNAVSEDADNENEVEEDDEKGSEEGKEEEVAEEVNDENNMEEDDVGEDSKYTEPDLEISNSGSETQNEQHSPFSEAVDPQEAAPSQPSPSQTTSGKPLLALTLTIRNKVDDQYVARPTNLSPDQKWELEYLLTEISNERVAWGKYHQVQDRRRNALDPDRNSSEDEGKLDFFRRQLRDLADQGRVWKRARDEVDERVGEAVVWVPDVQTTKVGEGSAGEGEGGGGGTTGEVEDVESYLRWLYGEGKPRG